MISVLAIRPKVRELKPGRGDGIFNDDKNPYDAFLRRGSKPRGPMLSEFMACKKSLATTDKNTSQGKIHHYFRTFLLLAAR
jgi:hypothetical protein